MTEFRQGYLRARSRESSDPKLLLASEYDVVVLSSSWDRRCVCIPSAGVTRAPSCILFLFSEHVSVPLRVEHDRVLKDFCKGFEAAHIIEGDVTNMRTLFAQFTEVLARIRAAAGRPLNILVDLSTCPRYLSLGVLSIGLKVGLASRVAFFYAEGSYPEEKSDADRHELFTQGGWEAMEIPGFEGAWDPEKPRMYLVSVGFEGSKTLRLIAKSEPDRVEVLFPDPGVKHEYVERTWKNNKPLFDTFRIEQSAAIRAHAGDAIAAWKALSERDCEEPAHENAYYLCCGTKSHSLALGLRALTLQSPAVLYISPDRHRVVDTAPLGAYWLFEIADVSVLAKPSRRLEGATGAAC